MNRKAIAAAAAILVALAIPGCGSSSSVAEAGSWNDGTYTETAEGKKGDFEVTVTIENGLIADISVGDNEETPDLGGVAIEEMPAEMIEAQSADVDGVSGATVTSDALKDAVTRCLEDASE